MNYGKTAYLKVLDIEKNLTQNQNNIEQLNNYLEINKPNINQTLLLNSPLIFDLPSFKTIKNKTICFQIKTSLFSQTNSVINLELIINNCIIHQEEKIINNGESDFIVLKTYTALSDSYIEPSIRLTNLDDSSVNINSITTVILGAEGNSSSLDIELRAIELKEKNQVLISFIDSNNLNYVFTSINEQSLKYEDFKYLLPAKSHSFCLSSIENEQTKENINLFRVDPNGNLYYSKIFANQSEQLLDKDVSVVHASFCPKVSDSTNIVAYIKNGRCYFRTLKDDVFTNERELNLPSGNYKDIRVATKEDSEFIYIIASHENGSNYILHSLTEVSTGKITEFISASCNFIIEKYIDMSFFNKLSSEHLFIDLTACVEAISYINEIIENLSKFSINVSCNFSVETYKVSAATVYGVRLDKNILIGLEWGSYIEDSKDFEPAYMDYDNDTFVDNGWKDRWPFNEIKPCLLKDGVVVGYLNPNNYKEFVDGTSSNITSYDSGYVMIEIPKMYYSITRTDDYIDVKISNKAKPNFYCLPFVYKGEEHDKIYVSAYLIGNQYMNKNGFTSKSGDSLNSALVVSYEYYYDELKTYSGENFEFMPFNVVTLIQCLYIVMFKNTDCQTSLGTGFSAYQKSHKVGTLDDKGMYYGTNDFTLGTKFLGLENLYACRQQMVTGFYIDTNNKPRFIDVYNPNSSYHPDNINDFITSDLPFTKSTSLNRFGTDINEDANHVGFFGSTYSSNRALGFCDAFNHNSNETGSCIWGTPLKDYNNGLFSLSTYRINYKNSQISARLVYYP